MQDLQSAIAALQHGGVIIYPLLVLANTGAGLTRWFYPDETLGDHSLLLPTMAVWWASKAEPLGG